MAFFALHSDITIGYFRFSGVHEVRTKRGIYGYNDYASIRLPSIGAIRRKSKREIDTAVIGQLFTDGDPVTIKLGYNGDLREEFRGFVKRRNLAMPLEIECEGYSRLLRLNKNLKGHFASTSAKKLLELACKGTGIKVECPVDFPLVGINLDNADGTQVIDHIKRCSDNTLTIFFKEPDVLWCGLVYSSYLAGTSVFGLPTVNFRLGYNVVKDNGLKERVPTENVQVIINGKLANGDAVRTASKDKTAARKVKSLLNNVPDNTTLGKFANEKADQMNYAGYEGNIRAFLQPFCLPGYDAKIVDARYPERDGLYLVESTEVIFGQSGARRIVGIGPKLS